MPKRSAQAPNSASAPCAPPLKRMTSSRFTGALFLFFLVRLFVFFFIVGRVDLRLLVLHEVRRNVDRVLVLGPIEVVHAARELRRDGTARLVFLLLKRLLLVFRRRGRTKVALARMSGAAFGMSRARGAVAAAGTRGAEAAA